MEPELAITIRNSFKAQMALRLPIFNQLRVEGRDDTIWSCEVAPELFFFIFLVISEKRNSFTVEIASNWERRYPFREAPGVLSDIPQTHSKRSWRFRISTLAARSEHWWTLAERQGPNDMCYDYEINSKVNEVISSICQVGVTFIEGIAEKLNHPINLRQSHIH